jgi:hypothetical protein
MTDELTDANVIATQQIDNVTYIKLADYARLHDVNGDRLRGMARDKKLPGAHQLFGKMWIVPRDMVAPVTAPRASTRPDGRKPYTLYMTDDERATVAQLIPAENIIDPRVVSRAKRAAKADANAN